MTKGMNLRLVYDAYEEHVRTTETPKKAKEILSQFRTGLLRVGMVGFGLERLPLNKPMTKADTQAALEFLATLPLTKLPEVRVAMQKGFDRLESSANSRRTYRPRVEQFLVWAEEQGFFPRPRSEKRKEYCPEMKHGKGNVANMPLTERTGKYKAYALKQEEMPLQLQVEMQKLQRFLTAEHYPGRVIEPLQDSSADTNLKSIRCMLGFVVRYAAQPVEIGEVGLSSLVPYVSEEVVEDASQGELKKLWRSQKRQLEAFIGQYFTFIQEFSESDSPSTRLNKVTALVKVFQFLYRDHVEDEEEYETHPLYSVLLKYLKHYSEQKQQWTDQGRRTVDETKKFPDSEPGKTALDVIRERVLEPLRQECNPRYKTGMRRASKSVAISLQRFIMWGLAALYPARRQQEPRSLKVALSCPLKRPDGIPDGGWYLPLPAPEERARRSDRTIKDNYLFRTYHHEGQEYPDGVYVLDIHSYKTHGKYGAQQIVLHDRKLMDGSTFYHYLERYFCGWWMNDPNPYRPMTYDWWEASLRGRRGYWVTAGRLSLLEPSTWGNKNKNKNKTESVADPSKNNAEPMEPPNFVFLGPRTGRQVSTGSYTRMFEQAAYKLISKRTSPHTMRYIWATWAFQVGLSDRELESLAYSMGHNVTTLKSFYERSTPTEKRRPIEQVIQKQLSQHSEEAEPDVNQPDLPTLIDCARRLTPEEQQRLVKALSA